jgi:hypothetical protein
MVGGGSKRVPRAKVKTRADHHRASTQALGSSFIAGWTPVERATARVQLQGAHESRAPSRIVIARVPHT